MKISVVIPTFNRAHTILRAVESVLKQSYKPFEIIIVNDGSTDDTLKLLHTFEKQITIISQSNKGVSAARNMGIRAAKGEWIALLDSDDEWLPKNLEKQVDYFSTNSDLNIFQSEEIWIRNGKRINHKHKHKKHAGWIFKECLPLCIVAPSAVMFTKKLWKEMNGFDETFPVCEDYDLWLRIARNYPIGLNENVGVIKYGGHEDQLSTTFPIMDMLRIKAIEKHLNDNSFINENRLYALDEIIKKLEIVIKGTQKRGRNVSSLSAKLEKYNYEKDNLRNQLFLKK